MYVSAQICRVEVNLVTYELVEYATGIGKMPVRRLWPNNGKAVLYHATDRAVLTDPRDKECETAAIMRLRLMSRWMQSIRENDKPSDAKSMSQLPNNPRQTSHSAHRKGASTHPHTARLILTTVLWHPRESVGLKGRDGLWEPKLPRSLCSVRQTQSFLGIVLGLEVRYEKHG